MPSSYRAKVKPFDQVKSRYSSPLERLNKSIVVDDNNCWIWQGKFNRHGYGILKVMMADNKSRPYAAHRFSYLVIRGNIPDELELDHLCRVISCVNPHHLEAVTRKVNNDRSTSLSAQNSKKTHCKRGHEFTGENTKIILKPYKLPGRQCRQCIRYLKRKYYYQSKELNNEKNTN